jgi:bacillithiol biosynthesis deacetylase BshB1
MIDILAIMAHPDDAELLCGGALLCARAAGRTTGILDLTAGERGSWGDVEGRSREAAAAASILGLSIRRTADLRDGELQNTPDARAIVAARIREIRPRIVITHWTEARHPDHRAAAELARDASFLAGVRNAPIEGEPYRPFKVVHAVAYAELGLRPTFVLDVTEQMDRKLDAIFAFGSQFEGRTAMGDVFGGGRPLREQILALHATYGSWIRRPYGEPYVTREAMRVTDLSGLDVSTF